MTPAAAAAILPGTAANIIESEIKPKIAQRTPRAANALRNGSIKVLTGPSPSAPGSPPGVRTGHLRGSWTMFSSASMFGITSGAHYAGYLEYGTRKMAARPFKDKIVETAMPEIIAIFSEGF